MNTSAHPHFYNVNLMCIELFLPFVFALKQIVTIRLNRVGEWVLTCIRNLYFEQQKTIKTQTKSNQNFSPGNFQILQR